MDGKKEKSRETGPEKRAETPLPEAQVKPEKNKKSSGAPKISAYFGVLLLVLGMVAGFTVKGALFPTVIEKKTSVPCPQPAPLELTLLYSSECGFCFKDNSMIASIETRHIAYELKELDIVSGEGKELAEKLEINSVPTLLVSAAELDAEPEYGDLRAVIRTNFELKGSHYVVPEMFLDQSPHNVMFLGPVEDYSPVEGKARVDEFADYLNIQAYENMDDVDELREEFGNTMDYRFRNFIVNGKNAELVAIAAECARKYGKFGEYRHRLLEKTHASELPVNVASPFYLKQIGEEVGIEQLFAFKSCIDGQDTLDIVEINKGSDYRAAKKFRLAWTPAYVVDSKYVTTMDDLRTVVCSVHPELEPCGVNE